jgi:anti-anti-sigma factor
MSPPADYTIHQHMGITVVSLQLESLLGVIEVNRIGTELMAMIEKGSRRFVLDLGKVKYAGSAALGMLLGLSSELNARNGKLILAKPDHLEPLLKVTRARGMFTIAPDAMSAMEMFSQD